MNEIKCPKCGTVFTVDESQYADIVRQVRDAEFSESVAEAAQAKADALKAQLALDLAAKDQQLETLKASIGVESAKHEVELEKVRAEYQAKEATHASEIERIQLAHEAEAAKQAAAMEKKLLDAKEANDQALRAKDDEIAERDRELRSRDEAIKAREDTIQDLRDMRSRLTVKLLGESLEQHCEIAFNQLRATAFRNAEFGKDNDASEGTKGDYIFREHTEAGAELISIMFEMKTEAEDSRAKSKRTNESHLKKLDDDRRKKGCEYAVLVSTLETDSELYNQGIVDVSHLYPKMFVIRPQFFIPLISLLRNAALDSAQYKDELELQRQQNIDVTKFEEKLNDFKEKFGLSYERASKKFATAIDEIDKTIAHLTKVREALVGSEKYLDQANRRSEELTVKKLTYGNPTMREKFKALEAAEEAAADDGED